MLLPREPGSHLFSCGSLALCSCASHCVLTALQGTSCPHLVSDVIISLSLLCAPKPLVLHQDSSILASRDLRLEKRTLFR